MRTHVGHDGGVRRGGHATGAREARGRCGVSAWSARVKSALHVLHHRLPARAQVLHREWRPRIRIAPAIGHCSLARVQANSHSSLRRLQKHTDGRMDGLTASSSPRCVGICGDTLGTARAVQPVWAGDRSRSHDPYEEPRQGTARIAAEHARPGPRMMVWACKWLVPRQEALSGRRWRGAALEPLW